MNHVDHIYYINLEYRTDRRLAFEEWLEETGVPMEKVTRIEGIYDPVFGYVGCVQSHLKAIKAFLDSGHKNCIIYEDDYTPLDPSTYWSSVQQVFDAKVDFDIVMLSYNVLESEETQWPWLHRVQKSFTASGLLLTREFAPKLFDVFHESYVKLVEFIKVNHRISPDLCNDAYWMKLMPISRWYCIYPRLGKQRESYSDLQKQITNYNA
jgi:hypothetical protein